MLRRLIGISLAVVLAAAGTAVLVLYVRSAEERALAGERTVDVLVVRQEIQRGTPAGEIEDAVDVERVPSKVQALGSVADLSELEGRVAAVDLVPGEQIVAQRFVQPQALEPRAQIDVPAGLLEVTIPLSPARAVGGQLAPGSTVAVLSSFNPFDIDGGVPQEVPEGTDPPRRTPTSTHLILHKVLVTNVQADQRSQQPADDAGTDSAPALAPTGNLLVTLALDAPSIERVVFTAEHGLIWLAIEPADAPEEGTRIQTRGTVHE